MVSPRRSPDGPPGTALSEAIGLAWASRRAGTPHAVRTLISAAELAASTPGDLATYAVLERLDLLQIVVHAATPSPRAEERFDDLRGRGWHVGTVGAHDASGLAAALRTRATGRPSLIYCVETRRPGGDLVRAAPQALAPPPSWASRREIVEVAPEGTAGEVGAFALGVASHGAYLPSCAIPLAEAFALTPALRRAARLGLPLRFRLLANGDEPADALPALQLIAGLDVRRAGEPAPEHAGPRVIVTAGRRAPRIDPSRGWRASGGGRTLVSSGG